MFVKFQNYKTHLQCDKNQDNEHDLPYILIGDKIGRHVCSIV